MPPLPSLSDIKGRLGLTTTADDTLLTALLADAVAQAGRDTGRTFSSASNVTTRYSSNGETSLVIDDRPYADASRTVILTGTTLIEGVNVWFLPDRRDQNISSTIQLRVYNQGPFRDFNWFDGNHDNPRYQIGGIPNDLVITGILGMPFPSQDVVNGISTLTMFLYWKYKSGGSGQVISPTGTVVDLDELDDSYARFVIRWRIRTAVTSAG